ncbi:MAG TPA: hypothetical protein EYQ53_06130 [Candidatus Poseidoniales archaeon]|nr:MAG: hypothetical protein CXT69_02615 [Euryarchaeota archaeon]HIG03938.1 hypothetical protein [Candidatus Poseidoniales archaeon]HIK78613.1 hypothetical protein [Candidatus Poseidoniales archaeon]
MNTRKSVLIGERDSVVGKSLSEKRWTIMAALLGTNMAYLLFQGIAQESNYQYWRQIGLVVLVASIPFQGIYFLIEAYVHEYSHRMEKRALVILNRLSIFCQIVSYGSIIGIAVIFYSFHWIIGATFLLSGLIAVVMVRLAMSQVSEFNLQEK